MCLPALMHMQLLSLMVNTHFHTNVHTMRGFLQKGGSQKNASGCCLIYDTANLRFLYLFTCAYLLITFCVTKRNNRFSHNGFAELWQPLNPPAKQPKTNTRRAHGIVA